jgi:FkbM family methyltransferase
MNEVLKSIIDHTRPLQEQELAREILGRYYHDAANGIIPVVLFCAGSSGKIICPFLIRNGIQPVCFCDNNASRVGESISGVPIISFEDLKRKHQDSLIVIVTAAYQNFIRRQLLDNGFDSERILTLDTTSPSFDDQLKRESVLMLARNGEPDRALEYLQSVDGKLLKAYNLLSDQKSKALFIRRFALIASGFEYQAYRDFLREFSEPILRFGYENTERLKVGGSYFYFNNDVILLKDGEVFVDGGAFIGDSAEEFIKACKTNQVNYKSIYCFEPDRSNYEKLLSNTSRYKNVTCINRGLWSCETTLRFVSSAQTESYGARIQEAGNIADVEIETVSIDAQLAGEGVSLIKMDIEGAEMEALKGAELAIRKYKPGLAISVYHKTDDLFEVPLLLHAMCPDYKLYLRHLGNYFDDTILFATI